MGLYQTFSTNRDLENKGIWVEDFPANDDGTTPGFLVSRMGKNNVEYQKALEALSKRFKLNIELDTLVDSVASEAVREVFITTVLKGWRNVYDAHGEPMEFTHENARKIFDELPDLYDYLVEKARKLSTFRDAEVDRIAGE